MFKSKTNIFLYTIVFIAILIPIAKFLGMIQIFIVPTAGNEPTIKTGAFCLGTNLVKPKKFDFVIYKQINPKYEPGYYCQRLVGEEKDKIQIKNGDLFVNDIMVDNKFTLSHSYIINTDYYNWLVIDRKKRESDIYQISDSQYIANLSKEEFNSQMVKERNISKEIDTAISNIYHHNWNADNFGPIIVPKDKIFTMGDNRNASLDSRYLGFIDVENIHGKLIYHSK